MPIGPGKYDAICTYARVQSNASGAVLMILNGKYGSGFSIQSTTAIKPATLADMLENLAKELRNMPEGQL